MDERGRPKGRGGRGAREELGGALRAHEEIVGETLGEASEALASAGIDAPAIARAARDRALALARRLDALEAAASSASWTPEDAPARSDARPAWIRARARGSSMAAMGIRDGDIVEADPAAQPRDGDTVLAEVMGRGRVVAVIRMSGGEAIRLEAAAPDVAPIVIDEPSELRVAGVVVFSSAAAPRS